MKTIASAIFIPRHLAAASEIPELPIQDASQIDIDIDDPAGQVRMDLSRQGDEVAIRMETRLPWRPTRGSLTSPSYLVRNRTLGPPLENNPEIPPSSRDEGLRLLHGLATNLATSLQTPQEA